MPERLDQGLLARHALVLHLHVRVERDERAVLQLRQRVDLGERHVVVEEQPGQASEHRRGALQRPAGDAGRGDDLLGLEVGEGLERGEVAATDVVGVLLGDLLDVDAAHVAEQHQRLLRGAVPDDARVVLLRDLGLRVDEHAARHVPADLQLQDVLGVGLGFLGRVGELDAAGLHPPAGEHLRLDHRRAVDPRGDLRRLGGIGREAVVGDRDARALDDLARLESKNSSPTSCGREAHTRRGRATSSGGRAPRPRRSRTQPVGLSYAGSFFGGISARLTITLHCFQVASSCILPSIMCTPRRRDRLDDLLGEGDLVGSGRETFAIAIWPRVQRPGADAAEQEGGAELRLAALGVRDVAVGP